MTGASVTELIDQCVDAVAHEDPRLTAWEKDFIEQMAQQWQDWGSVSDKQRAVLQTIVDEKIL